MFVLTVHLWKALESLDARGEARLASAVPVNHHNSNLRLRLTTFSFLLIESLYNRITKLEAGSHIDESALNTPVRMKAVPKKRCEPVGH